MGLCRIFPRIGVLPEIRAFRCAACEEIVTLVEGDPQGANATLGPSDSESFVTGQA